MEAISQLNIPPPAHFLSVGRHMPRTRYQEGHVEETGTKTKKWKGHFFVYVRQTDGSEKRVHKSKVLGLKSKLRKKEAEEQLKAFITRITNQTPGEGAQTVSGKELTLRWFFDNRYRPMNEPKWKESSKSGVLGNIDRYVLRIVGDIPLAELNKFTLQMRANELAAKFSDSVVSKYMIWTKAILNEAVEQDFIRKNPAKQLDKPATRGTDKRVTSQQDIRIVIQCLNGRVRVALLVSFVLGLRPAELLALRWDDLQTNALRIDESARDGKLYSPKTEASTAHVWLPEEVKMELLALRPDGAGPRDFVFPNRKGNPYRLDNFRTLILKPGLEAAKEKAAALGMQPEALQAITFQVCRRTCGTYLQKHGGVKDVQAHLRHAKPSTTFGIYVQAIPDSVRDAVHGLYGALFGPGELGTAVLNKIVQ
jgi:integrase